MKIYRKLAGLLLITISIFVSSALLTNAAETQKSKVKAQEPSKTTPQVARDRYVVIISGCNDCHTRGYLQSEAKVPESDWFTGEWVTCPQFIRIYQKEDSNILSLLKWKGGEGQFKIIQKV